MKKLLICCLSVIFTLQACKNSNTPPETNLPEFEVYTLQESKITTVSVYPALIRGTTDIEIRPQVGGILQKTWVDEGALVTKNQLLFTIDDQLYREQFHNSVGNLNAAKAALTQAQLEIDKLTPLVKNKVVSDYQLKTAYAAHQAALANVEQATALVEHAKINLNYTQIYAPIDGYLGQLRKRQGSLLAPSDPHPITTLSNVQEVYVYFSLSELDFITFKEQNTGTTLEEKINQLSPVSLQLADKTIYEEPGKIDLVNGQFDSNTGAIMLRATFPNLKGVLRSGNTGKIQLEIHHHHALVVPQEATVEIQDKVFVFYVDENNQVFKKPIHIMDRSGTNYLVGEPLKSGDQIVLKGFHLLQDGTTIRPQTAIKDVATPHSNL